MKVTPFPCLYPLHSVDCTGVDHANVNTGSMETNCDANTKQMLLSRDATTEVSVKWGLCDVIKHLSSKYGPICLIIYRMKQLLPISHSLSSMCDLPQQPGNKLQVQVTHFTCTVSWNQYDHRLYCIQAGKMD